MFSYNCILFIVIIFGFYSNFFLTQTHGCLGSSTCKKHLIIEADEQAKLTSSSLLVDPDKIYSVDSASDQGEQLGDFTSIYLKNVSRVFSIHKKKELHIIIRVIFSIIDNNN